MSNVRELPPVGGLTEKQVRGIACVDCGVALDNATAVDLGSRPIQRAGVQVRWFPRSCPRCAGGGS